MTRNLLSLVEALSPREAQLVRLAAQGFTDNAISAKLGISLPTVSTYWGRIRMKMGPMNRTELVAHYLREKAEQSMEALKRENESLVQQIRSQTETVTELKANVEMLRGIVEVATDAILIVDESGQILLANEAASTLFGWSEVELANLKIEELVPPRFRYQHALNRHTYYLKPERRQMGDHNATFAVRKDGSEFPIATFLSAQQTPHGLAVTCVVRDITQEFAMPASA